MQIFLLKLHGNTKLLQHRPQLILLVIHTSIDNLFDWFVEELHETMLAGSRTKVLAGPFLNSRIKIIFTSEPFHHLKWQA